MEDMMKGDVGKVLLYRAMLKQKNVNVRVESKAGLGFQFSVLNLVGAATSTLARFLLF